MYILLSHPAKRKKTKETENRQGTFNTKGGREVKGSDRTRTINEQKDRLGDRRKLKEITN